MKNMYKKGIAVGIACLLLLMSTQVIVADSGTDLSTERMLSAQIREAALSQLSDQYDRALLAGGSVSVTSDRLGLLYEYNQHQVQTEGARLYSDIVSSISSELMNIKMQADIDEFMKLLQQIAIGVRDAQREADLQARLSKIAAFQAAVDQARNEAAGRFKGANVSVVRSITGNVAVDPLGPSSISINPRGSSVDLLSEIYSRQLADLEKQSKQTEAEAEQIQAEQQMAMMERELLRQNLDATKQMHEMINNIYKELYDAQNEVRNAVNYR